MSEKSIRWFCPQCNDFVSIRKTDELKNSVMNSKRLPYPIIIKHGNPAHFTILQLDRDLRDRGRLTTTDYIDLTEKLTSDKQEHTTPIHNEDKIKEKLESISEEISKIQRKIWDLLEK